MFADALLFFFLVFDAGDSDLVYHNFELVPTLTQLALP